MILFRAPPLAATGQLCGFSQGELIDLLEKAGCGQGKNPYNAYFFNVHLQKGLWQLLQKRFKIEEDDVCNRCIKCGRTIDEHPNVCGAPAQPQSYHYFKNENDVIDMFSEVRNAPKRWPGIPHVGGDELVPCDHVCKKFVCGEVKGNSPNCEPWDANLVHRAVDDTTVGTTVVDPEVIANESVLTFRSCI